MLLNLAIRDIVLIERAEIRFGEGLCVLTGETGAGKSILLDSLGLALGARAESGLVRRGCEKGEVIAEFALAANAKAALLLREHALEGEEESLIIRRSVGGDGRSKAFINDRPVSLALLRALGETLVEMHGQHDQRGLLEPAAHLAMLDAFAGATKEAAAVEAAYEHWKRAREERAALEAHAAQARREEDYLRHVLKELDALAPEEGEEDRLAEERRAMQQNEKLAATLSDALSELMGASPQARPADIAIANALKTLYRLHAVEGEGKAEIASASLALERAGEALAEGIGALEVLQRDCRYDGARRERLEDRLFGLRAAARKYGRSVEELPRYREEVARQLGLIEHQEAEAARLELACRQAREAYLAAANILSERRSKAAGALERQVSVELNPLKMERARFCVALQALQEAEWGPKGVERAAFLIAANPGAEPAPLGKVASGGELSRLMLALKVALKEKKSVPTLIFDEVDTGIGGATADAVGQRLEWLGGSAQVLVVTHQPQVAARGHHHYRIQKALRGKQAVTRIEHLSPETRREEIARMLAGAEITEEARAAAEKLMGG